MLNKLKRVLGIEGVKVFLDTPEILEKNASVYTGKIILSSITDATVEQINIKILEKYERGNKQDKRIDIYEIGNLSITKDIVIKANTKNEIEFRLHYFLPKSEMDVLGEKNLILKGIVFVAKYFKKVKSEYSIEVEVLVKDTRLHPFDKKILKIK